MTSGSGSARRRRRSKLLVPVLCAALLLGGVSPASAQGGIKQYQRRIALGGRLSGAIILVGYAKDAGDIGKLLTIVVQKANAAYANLDWRNPASQVGQLNARAGTKEKRVRVTDDVFAAFQAALKVSRWTKGAFDIAYAGKGSYKDIKLKGNSVELKRSGMQVRFDPIVAGFLADLILRYLYTGGMQNAIVKVGNVFRGMGNSIGGPWKVQVQDDEGTFARHALNLTVRNTGISTVSANQYRHEPLIDPRSKKRITPPCRGVTAVMSDAALAQGIAHAAFVAGYPEGFSLLSQRAKGLMVDNQGRFHRTPGF